jgi:hypothetical protein
MVYFQTKNPNLGKFWRALDWKMMIFFMAIWNILQTFLICYDRLAHFVFIWYIFPGLVLCMYEEKSGNPAKTIHSTSILSSAKMHLGILHFTLVNLNPFQSST